MELELLDKAIRRVPDFPKPGILFYDITGILVNPEAFKICIDKMVDIYKDKQIDAVAGVESRGFIFAAPLAEKLGIPLVLIRKKHQIFNSFVNTSNKHKTLPQQRPKYND